RRRQTPRRFGDAPAMLRVPPGNQRSRFRLHPLRALTSPEHKGDRRCTPVPPGVFARPRKDRGASIRKAVEPPKGPAMPPSTKAHGKPSIEVKPKQSGPSKAGGAPMKAWVAKGAKQPLVLETIEPGPLGAEEVEVEVEHCGLCHSDLSVLN